MRSTRVCATTSHFPVSRTSQSPIQKSNCRYSGPEQKAGFANCCIGTRAAVSPSIIASKARTKNKLIFGHQAACLILRGSLAAFALDMAGPVRGGRGEKQNAFVFAASLGCKIY